MRAVLLSTDGPWLEASLRTTYGTLAVMDEFSISEMTAPSIGEEFEVELSAELDEDESWEELFSSNRGREKRLESMDGWSYRAFGEVLSIIR